jgi:hypothetical protein
MRFCFRAYSAFFRRGHPLRRLHLASFTLLREKTRQFRLDVFLLPHFRDCSVLTSMLFGFCTTLFVTVRRRHLIGWSPRVPMRLLDSSDGALGSLHFAARNKRAPLKTDATIFVMDPRWVVSGDCADQK